jgi:pimeloyl-ACP methyl ester carboxylesterase
MLSKALVHIGVDGADLEGMLELPQVPLGIVLFAHGSGSSRFSPRNNYVARVLREARIGSLLVDLLTAEEDRFYDTRFDIPLLTRRLFRAATYLHEQNVTAALPLGVFGASTGAAAALQVAADPGLPVAAVVARGGRPDLAGAAALHAVEAPTLLIVGGHDRDVVKLNRSALAELHCPKDLAIVAGAGHLFEEPGALEDVARLASDWFTGYFAHA